MDDIDRIRAFNRFYTARLGVMDKAFMGSRHSLGDIRIIFELGQVDGLTARDISALISIDEGQLSRNLAALQKQGLVARRRSTSDARRVLLSLTQEGRTLLKRYVKEARSAVREMTAGMNPSQLSKMADAMVLVQNSITGTGDIMLRDLAPGDVGWVLQRHGEYYAQSEGFDASFEQLVAKILADYLAGRDSSRERAWIAYRGSERLGCIFCVRGPEPHVAKLRLFFVEPGARGQKLGLRLITECMAWARARGYEKMVLWTHESHREACALYAANGFHVTASNSVENFGQQMIEQHWEKQL